MTKTKFLYGAAVQGIQSFIFQTNKLKEIAGGSEIVEQICDAFFKENLPEFDDSKLIIGAAGNIKYLFESAEQCKLIVHNFPKKVMELAPGISLSQAVVKVETELELKHINDLEDKLKIQRNKQLSPLDFGCLITKRAQNTGKSAVELDKEGKEIDAGVREKRKANQKYTALAKKFESVLADKRFPFDFEELVKNTQRSWMAVIHADGNGLGKVLQQLGKQLENKGEAEVISVFRSFSKMLEKSTVDAANKALTASVIKAESGRGKKEFLPFRPIILGGDDLTVVMRSEYALDFTSSFLEEFEKATKDNLGELFKKYGINREGLTACAGIAYIKSSFPFHYGYQLAEQLCEKAKKEARKIDANNVPSSLNFHKVQSSFIGKFEDIVKQELTCYDELSFMAGPYYLNQKGNASIKNLADLSNELLKEGAPAAQLRKWLTERYSNTNKAKSLMERTIQVLKMDKQRERFIRELDLDPEKYMDAKIPCPYYDYVSMSSLLKN